MALSGYLDRVVHRTVYGWAFDESPPSRPVILEVRINGIHAGNTVADRFRSDLQGAGIGNGEHSFRFFIPDRFEEIRSVEVRALSNGYALPHALPEMIDARTNRPLPPEWRSNNGSHAFPSFFLLGAAKSGTTSLHYYLSQCQGIYMSNPKEPFFFEAEWERGPTYYFNRYFSDWNGEQVVGEARHRNLFLPHVPARIKAYNPNARLLAILRNPVERAVSHWWHWYSSGFEKLSLRESLDRDLLRMDEERGADRCSATWAERYSTELDKYEATNDRSYLESGHYLEQIMRYLRLFPREQLHVILFGDMARQPERVVAETLRFLDLPASGAANLNYEVRNRSHAGMWEHVDTATLRMLQDYYRARNAELAEFLGRPLTDWDQTSALAQA